MSEFNQSANLHNPMLVVNPSGTFRPAGYTIDPGTMKMPARAVLTDITKFVKCCAPDRNDYSFPDLSNA